MRPVRPILAIAALSALCCPVSAFATAEAVFTSANHGTKRTVVADKIIAVMTKAKTSIKIAVAHLNSDQIVAAIVAIQKDRNENDDPSDDIDIQMLLDLGQYRDRKSKATVVEEAGITVRYKTYSLSFFHPQSQLMHHKFVLVDGKELVTGSYNWSDTAEKKNYENVIHYYGRNVKTIVREYEAEFNKLWGLNRETYPEFLQALEAQPGEPGYKRIVPTHFNSDYFNSPMTLDRTEVMAIRSATARMGFFADFGNIGRRFFDREAVAGLNDDPGGAFLGEDAPQTSSPGSSNSAAKPPTESVDAGAGIAGTLGESSGKGSAGENKPEDPRKPEETAKKDE